MDYKQQNKLLDNIKLLRKNAPSVYVHYKAQQIPKLTQDLQDLRLKYKESNLHDKNAITVEATRIKTILKELEIDIPGGDTHE